MAAGRKLETATAVAPLATVAREICQERSHVEKLCGEIVCVPMGKAVQRAELVGPSQCTKARRMQQEASALGHIGNYDAYHRARDTEQ